jgi:hypothetical protein
VLFLKIVTEPVIAVTEWREVIEKMALRRLSLSEIEALDLIPKAVFHKLGG